LLALTRSLGRRDARPAFSRCFEPVKDIVAVWRDVWDSGALNRGGGRERKQFAIFLAIFGGLFH
jgi:hypothetical protein